MRRDGSDTLYLFTYSFPTGSAETFLETEIDYLARGWPRVVVLPARLGGERRPLPPNVEVEEELGRTLLHRNRPAEVVAALLDPAFRGELIPRPRVLLSPGRLRRLIGQILVARRTERWIGDYLRRSGAERPLCYTYWCNLAAFGLARLRTGWKGMTFVSRGHGKDLYLDRHDPPYLPLQREVVARADAVFPVSEHGRAYLGRQHRDVAARIEVARLGVRAPRRLCEPSDDGRWRVLSCAGLRPVKRIDLLVRGLEELARRHPERRIEWTHLGDGPLRASIEEEARARLPKNVSWRFAGQVANDAVITFYQEHPVDVLVNVSESEGVPVSMMEAQSFGVPIVATAVGGVPEIVNEESGALVSPEATPIEIAEGLERVLAADDEGHNALRTSARANWAARYDADRNYTAFVELLQELTNRGTN